MQFKKFICSQNSSGRFDFPNQISKRKCFPHLEFFAAQISNFQKNSHFPMLKVTFKFLYFCFHVECSVWNHFIALCRNGEIQLWIFTMPKLTIFLVDIHKFHNAIWFLFCLQQKIETCKTTFKHEQFFSVTNHFHSLKVVLLPFWVSRCFHFLVVNLVAIWILTKCIANFKKFCKMHCVCFLLVKVTAQMSLLKSPKLQISFCDIDSNLFWQFSTKCLNENKCMQQLQLGMEFFWTFKTFLFCLKSCL